jgi:hypothetical protein
MNALSILAGLCLFTTSALAAQESAPPPEKLYFSLELRNDGKLLARPKLLGEVGKALRVERRQPGASEPDYQLVLLPSAAAGEESFRIQVELTTPQAKGQSDLSLLHGQERSFALGKRPGELDVVLMVMKVDSPEFRALMDLGARAAPERSSGAI